MNNEINTMYINDIILISMIDKAISSFRVQNYDLGLRISTIVMGMLERNIGPINKVAGSEQVNLLTSHIKNLLQAQENKDYVLLADLYELQMKPFFLEMQAYIMGLEEFIFRENCFIENFEVMNKFYPELSELIYSMPNPQIVHEQGYEAEFTSCGLMTLALSDKAGRYYLHSNGRVLDEAYTLVNSWYKEDKTNYIVYGYGLGYHIMELANLNSDITVEVFEADLNILRLASTYTEIRNIISRPNVKLVYDPTIAILSERISQMDDNTEFVIHYPSLRNIKNTEIKQSLEQYFIHYSSVKNQLKSLNGNFNENIKHYDNLVDELKQVFHNKDLYIVAAGPSLDKNFLQLKEVRENSIVLATGTVFRKLLTAGITPDYVIVTDANERVYAQIAGLEECSIPMLILSTAFQGFAKNYQGKKYMICQREYQKAEEYASKAGRMLFNTGGSVSTIALDIGIAFHCKRIIFLGLDLAYTDHFIHAADTSLRELNDTKDLRQIEDINGNMIYTSKSLDMYRKWIENRIRGVEEIEFIDASEGGARIEGMKIMQLSDCISGSEISTNS